LFTSDQHIRQHSYHTTSNHKRTLLNTLLFTSFTHFRSTYSTTFTSYNIKSQTNTTEDTSVHLFCSLPINIFNNIHIIQYQITNEHYSPHFCSSLLLTSDQHIRQHTHHTTSNHKRTLRKTLLFTSFAHYRSAYSTTLTSYNIKSQTNTTQHTSVHLFYSFPINIFDNIHIIQHQITNEHYSPHFCSPLLLTTDQHIQQHSHHTISNHKRTLLTTLLFISFTHFRSTYSTTHTSYNIKS